jgi:hypothetical protein
MTLLFAVSLVGLDALLYLLDYLVGLGFLLKGSLIGIAYHNPVLARNKPQEPQSLGAFLLGKEVDLQVQMVAPLIKATIACLRE